MKAFLDTNILVYAQEAGARGDVARELVADGGMISVQNLNELASVLSRKLKRNWSEVAAVLEDVRTALDDPLPVTLSTAPFRAGIRARPQRRVLRRAHPRRCDRSGLRNALQRRFSARPALGDCTIVNPFLAGDGA